VQRLSTVVICEERMTILTKTSVASCVTMFLPLQWL